MLKGLQNFLEFLNNNWTTIIIIISLIVALYEKIKRYVSSSNEEKIEQAKAQVKEICLKLVTDAEVDYESWHKAGSIKRAQVIQKIFDEYPILSKVVDQESLIKWIDITIDESLVKLREIVSNQSNEE